MSTNLSFFLHHQKKTFFFHFFFFSEDCNWEVCSRLLIRNLFLVFCDFFSSDGNTKENIFYFGTNFLTFFWHLQVLSFFSINPSSINQQLNSFRLFLHQKNSIKWKKTFKTLKFNFEQFTIQQSLISSSKSKSSLGEAAAEVFPISNPFPNLNSISFPSLSSNLDSTSFPRSLSSNFDLISFPGSKSKSNSSEEQKWPKSRWACRPWAGGAWWSGGLRCSSKWSEQFPMTSRSSRPEKTWNQINFEVKCNLKI